MDAKRSSTATDTTSVKVVTTELTAIPMYTEYKQVVGLRNK